MAQTTVVHRTIYVPLSAAGVGYILEPAYTALISALLPLSTSGQVYGSELHNTDFTSYYRKTELFYLSANDAAAMSAINTFASSLSTQNSGANIPVETHEVAVVRGTA